MNVRTHFTKEDRKAIVQAIADAESETSGEIRVHLADKCKGEILDKAAHTFKRLKMHEKHHRNGVLVYLAVSDHKFAIIGDAGIHTKIPDGYWDTIKDEMAGYFSRNDLTGGLKKGIMLIGEKLKEYFPLLPDGKSEPINKISLS